MVDLLGALFKFSLTKFLSVNSIDEVKFVNKIIFCSRLKEYGIIRLKVSKGLIPIPKSLHFFVPQGARIDTNVKDETEVSDLVVYTTKGYHINVSKMKASRAQEISIKYERYVGEDVFTSIDCEKEGEKIYVINRSDLKFLGYKVASRFNLPINMQELVESGKEKFREDMEKRIEIVDEKGNMMEFLPDYNIYFKSDLRLEIVVSWLADLDPYETKSFRGRIKEN